MYKQRLVFIGVWLLGIIALMIYPGFEAKGLAWGLIIGYWPFALCGEYGDTITLLSMFVLSAVEVGLCAWIMDKYNVTKKIWAVLLFSIIAGVVIIYYSSADYYDTWRFSTISSVVPEGYDLTVSDFNNLYLIPKMIGGGMIGTYLATAFSFLYAMGMILYKKIRLTSRMQTTADSRACSATFCEQ